MSDNNFNDIDILENENIIDYMKRRIDTLHAEKLEDMQTIHDLKMEILDLSHKLKAVQASLEIKEGLFDSVFATQKPTQN